MLFVGACSQQIMFIARALLLRHQIQLTNLFTHIFADFSDFQLFKMKNKNEEEVENYKQNERIVQKSAHRCHFRTHLSLTHSWIACWFSILHLYAYKYFSSNYLLMPCIPLFINTPQKTTNALFFHPSIIRLFVVFFSFVLHTVQKKTTHTREIICTEREKNERKKWRARARDKHRLYMWHWDPCLFLHHCSSL